MILDLTAVSIQLRSKSSEIDAGWRTAFAGWLRGASTAYSASLQVELSPIITPPAAAIAYHDPDQALTVYIDEGSIWLHFHDGALVMLPALDATKLQATITPPVLAHGRLLDVTYTALAPLLRRRGVYLVHGFAAGKNGRSLLLVGPSGSGKTTAGVSLLRDGWHLLGNDVVMLHEKNGVIHTLPTPGPINWRQPQTPLPGLNRQAESTSATDGVLWAPPLPLRFLCFPEIVTPQASALSPLPPGIALARLMAQSVDRWDQPALYKHIACLRRLCTQTAVYTLRSGIDVARWPRLLATAARAEDFMRVAHHDE